MTETGGDDRYADPLTGEPIANPNLPPPYFGGYVDPPGYHDEDPEPPRSGRRLLVAGLVAIVLAAGGIVTLTLVKAGTDDTPAAQPPRTTAPRASRSSAPRYSVAPVLKGWQAVAADLERVAYDVPPDWKVEEPGTLVGFEDTTGPRTAIHAVSTYQPEACVNASGSYRAHAGFTKLTGRDPRSAAGAVARLWAEAAAQKPQGDPSVPEPPAVATHISTGAPAWTASATVTPRPGYCEPPTLKITTVTFGVAGGTAVFVIYADQGVPDALPDTITDRIITTLRPA